MEEYVVVLGDGDEGWKWNEMEVMFWRKGKQHWRSR